MPSKKTDLKKLTDKFDPADLEWRVQRSGIKNGKGWAMVLAYITNRAVMDRLDEVVGAENWTNEYKEAPDGGILCGISINRQRDSGGYQMMTKWDGADKTAIEATKGGLSDSMKRAAVQWGIGRYLYHFPTHFVEIKEKGQHYIKIEDKKTGKTVLGYWDDPELSKDQAPEPTEDPTPTETAEPSPAKHEPVRLLNGEQVAQLIRFAKMKGAATREEAVSFINGALLTPDFTKLDPAYFDNYKKTISDPKVTFTNSGDITPEVEL